MIQELILICLSAGFLAKGAPDIDTSKVVEFQASVLLSDSLIGRANAYTGFDKQPGFIKRQMAQPELVQYTNYQGPFLMDRINGHQVWRVTYYDIPITSGNRTVRRDFRVLLEATTGQLLDVYSICDSVGSADTITEPKGNGFEWCNRCGGLPMETPSLALKDVLDSLNHAIASSKVIRAVYVNSPDDDSTAQRRWIIISIGQEQPMQMSVVRLGPPNGKNQSQPDPRFRNSHEYVIDAASGKCLYFFGPPYKRPGK